MNSLAVIIPTWNAARRLPRCVSHLEGDVRVIVVDGGSLDGTAELAAGLGATVVHAARGRGVQLQAGGRYAIDATTCDWLMFLHADTALEAGWRAAADAFMAAPSNRERAAVFQFGLDDDSRQAVRLAAMVRWRVWNLGLPYGDQGLLIHRQFYLSLGGYKPLPLMEDVDLIRRIGPHRFSVLAPKAITSADRWRAEGWWRRSTRNVLCLVLYFVGVPPARIAKIYG